MKTLNTLLLSFLFVVLTASSVSAKPSAELIRYVPGASPLIVGFELTKVKNTHLFDEALAFLNGAAADGTLLKFVLSKKAFDFETDITSAVVAFQTAPTNPQQPPPPAMAVVDGTFDQQRVKTAIEGRYGKVTSRKVGVLEVMSTAGVDFAFVDPTTLVIADSAFGPPTWKAAADEAQAASMNKEILSLMQLTDTTRGVWFAMNTKAVPTPPGSPPMDGAGVSVDLRNGLALDFRSRFAKAADAVTAKNQAEELKKTTQDPLLEMIGATPLVTNLIASIHDERVLALNTTMKDAEVRVMLIRLKSLNEAPPPVAPSGQPPTTTGAPPKPTQPGKGTKADFN